jgi:type I site-specific restriction-modification system R (restriction) subunit
MTEVFFSTYDFRREASGQDELIFDPVRKKKVLLTPEEWVRQHILQYLIHNKAYPKSMIAVERGFDFNGLKKRFDVLVFDKNSHPIMIVECKAPGEEIDEKVFRQIATYNAQLKVKYLWVTNGNVNFCCSIGDTIELLQCIPDYNDL